MKPRDFDVLVGEYGLTPPVDQALSLIAYTPPKELAGSVDKALVNEPLARQVETVSHRLSRPSRWMAYIGCVAALGAGGAAVAYGAEAVGNTELADMLSGIDQTGPKIEYIQSPGKDLHDLEAISVIGVGLVSAVAGHSVGRRFGNKVVGPRVAHHRAKNIIEKATSTSEPRTPLTTAVRKLIVRTHFNIYSKS